MARHTPGPWQCHHWQAAAPELDNARESAFVVKCRRVSSLAESDADARLISAAPDLLAALRQIEAMLVGTDHGATVFAALRIAHAAIARADGTLLGEGE